VELRYRSFPKLTTYFCDPRWVGLHLINGRTLVVLCHGVVFRYTCAHESEWLPKPPCSKPSCALPEFLRPPESAHAKEISAFRVPKPE